MQARQKPFANDRATGFHAQWLGRLWPHLVHRVAQLQERGRDRGLQGLPRFGERHGPHGAGKELDAKVILQGPNLLTDRPLASPQALPQRL